MKTNRTILAAAAAATVIAPRSFMSEGTAPTAGQPAAAAKTGPRVPPQVTAVFAGVKMPESRPVNNRGSKSLYPFDELTAVGQSFGVKNKTAAALSSIISNANKKGVQPKKDASGNTIFKTQELKGADGTVTHVPTQEPETEVVKHFFAHDVTPEFKKANAEAFAKEGPFYGASVLVFRDK